MSGLDEAEFGSIRKKLKRDTKRCFECRRRKVKCQLATEDVPACSECVKRGFKCSLDTLHSSNAGSQTELEALKIDHDKRFDRIERLLSNLVAARDVPDPSLAAGRQILLPKLVDKEEKVETSQSSEQLGDSPLRLLLQNGMIKTASESTSCPKPSRLSEHEHIRQKLRDLLPSQQQVNIIIENSHGWAMEMTANHVSEPKNGPSYFEIEKILQSDCLTIGKTLLYLALYIQQIPPQFDQQYDSNILHSQVGIFIDSVNSTILAKESLACSVEGVECLLVLGVIYLNEGALRPAWMAFRRALNLAQLQGFHKSYSPNQTIATPILEMHHRMWLSAVMGDSFMSLLLGIESGTGPEPFGILDNDWNMIGTKSNAPFQRQMCLIQNDIIRRNLMGSEQGFDLTGTIDKKLTDLEAHMPSSWWQIPALFQEKSLQVAIAFDTLTCQSWFFQLQLFTHLPYAFKSTYDEQLNHSRKECLSASRALIHRYLALRKFGNTQLHCRINDFSAFIATLTILLLVQQPSLEELEGTNGDYLLVQELIQSMKVLGQSSGRETVAKQSAEFLNALFDISKSLETQRQELRIAVPYFGMVTITTSPNNLEFSNSPYIPAISEFLTEGLMDSDTFLLDSFLDPNILSFDSSL